MTAAEMQAAIAQPQARLDLGRVIGRTFGAIGANFTTFFLLAILLAAVPNLLIGLGVGYLAPSIYGGVDSATVGFRAMLVALGAAVLGMIPTYVLIGALTQGAIVHYDGRKARFGECLSTGFRFLLSLVGLGLATAVGLMLWLLVTAIPASLVIGFGSAIFGQTGSILAAGVFGIVAGVAIFIPAAMAMIRWSVAAPSLVAERSGVMEAFTRSGNLTRNNRWAIFFLALIWFVISIAIQWTITFVGASALMGMAGSLALGGLLLAGVTLLYSALNTMILATGQSALYYELRVLKEGATSEELAKIFE